MEERKSWFPPLFINSFVLKVIALALMTIDHFIAALQVFGIVSSTVTAVIVLRGICRIAYPLFCFMIVQGAIHTRRFGNYALRLGIMAAIIAIGLILGYYLPFLQIRELRDQGVIFIDLLLGAVAVYCLKNKNWGIKALAILPLAYSVVSTFARGLDCYTCGNDVWFIPFFLRCQYDFLGVLMMILMYVGYEFANYILSRYNGIYDNTKTQVFAQNLGMILGVVVANLAFYFFQLNATEVFSLYVNTIPDIQMISTFAILFIFFYNGRPGYNKIWFRHGSYLYYVVHILIIFGIFMLIFGY